jgi:acetolactate synthase small subunit
MNKKQKNIALWVGFFLVLWMVYLFAIQKTLETKAICSTLQKEKELLHNATQKMSYLQQKNKHFNALLEENNISENSSFQQILLQKISAFSEKENLEILGFNEPHRIENGDTREETYFIEIKGDFTHILQLINSLEQKQLGELISVNFIKKKNYRTNRKYLIAQLYLQKISQ